MTQLGQIESLWSGLFDEDGEPLAYGRVYTYTTGTSTALATYTDAAQTTQQTNPIILDGQGRSLSFGKGIYRFVIKDSDGNTLRTLDDLSYDTTTITATTATITTATITTATITTGLFGDGSQTAPSIAFAADTNTGIYRITTDELGITVGGTRIVRVSGLSTYFYSSTVDTAHTVYLYSDPSSGDVYLSLKPPTSVANAIISSTDGIDIYASSGYVALINSEGIKTVSGDSSIPSYSFISDTNTGIYSIGADNLGVATGGTLRFDISTTAITATLPIKGSDGTVSLPAYSFSGDTNTGIYRIGADNIGIAIAGGRSIDISAGNTRFFSNAATAHTIHVADDGARETMIVSPTSTTNSIIRSTDGIDFEPSSSLAARINSEGIRTIDGSLSIPSYSFLTNTDTGFALIGGKIVVIVDGVEMQSWG